MSLMSRRGNASTVAAAVLSLVLMAACGAGDGEGTGQSTGPSPTVTGGGTVPTESATPTPLSVKDYGTRLTKAMTPLQTALVRLANAKRYKGLERRVGDVEAAAGKAGSALAKLTPPAELAEPNARLVTALQAFGGETSSLGAKVGQRSLCTGATVRAGLGNADATTALRKAVASVNAALPGDQRPLKLPAADLKAGSRLPNGRYLRDRNRGGRAELAIENGGSSDAVVTLSKSGKPAIAVYVRKGKSYTVRNVSDGTYDVFFSVGSGWDSAARGFGKNCSFSRFEDPMKFRTTRDARGIYWQNFRITLQPVVGGTARTGDVDPNDFPDS
jgi:hypothetical protein